MTTTRDGIDMAQVMETYRAHFGGQFVARCPQCRTVCVYWDEDDLDDDGHLVCHCPSILTDNE